MRILLIRPCCIGDVIMATATLSALRSAYPDAHITWAVGGWSRRAIDYHPSVDTFLDTGVSAMPVKSISGFLRFVQQMRAGNFDIVVSLVRSPLMSLAVLLSGIPQRLGIDSNRRGFGYTLPLKISPNQAQHEAQIYLDVVGQLGIPTKDFQANLPVLDSARASIQQKLAENNINKPYIVINPAGGNNPGMSLDSKRWLPENFAQLANQLSKDLDCEIVLLAGPDDAKIIDAVRVHLDSEPIAFIGTLSFPEIGALASLSRLYIGNDTGLTHIASASGAKTAMILGLTDPQRYAPFTDNSIALWKPIALDEGGVASVKSENWDWQRDGISVEQALSEIRQFLDV